MKFVNKYFIADILSPLQGLGDSNDESLPYYHINPGKKEQVVEMLANLVRPDFLNKTELIKKKSKLALSYYLTTDKLDFQSFYNSYLYTHPPPLNAKDYYIWLWEVLFGNESYILGDADEYVEKNDPNEVLNSYF